MTNVASTSTIRCEVYDDERAFNTISKTPTPATATTMTTTSHNALMNSATEQHGVPTTTPPNDEHDDGNNEDEKDEERNKIDNDHGVKLISAVDKFGNGESRIQQLVST